MTHKYKNINAVMTEELKELSQGEHGEALKAWTSECVDTGYRKGLACGIAATILCSVATYIIKEMRGGIIEKQIQRNVNKLIRKLDISKH